MGEISRIVQRPLLKLRGPSAHSFRFNRSFPPAKRFLFLRAAIVQIGQPLDGAANKAATKGPDSAHKPAEGSRLQPDIVVKEKYVLGAGGIKQRLSVLGETTAREMSSKFHRAALSFQHLLHCSHYGLRRRQSSERLI
jgi:hypothetical protein